MSEPTRAQTTAADLVELVTSLPGVGGIEPGIGTTLRALDARIRRTGQPGAHFGVHIDRDAGWVTVEVCVAGPGAVHEVVADIQRAVHAALRDVFPPGPQVRVRVQSVRPRTGGGGSDGGPVGDTPATAPRG